MDKARIISAKVDQCSGGPNPAIFVAEVKLKTKSEPPFFFTITEIEGMPTLFKTKKSIFRQMMNLSSCSDEEFANLMETNQLYCGENYNGIFKTGNHFDFYDGIRYLIYLIRADWTEIKPYIAQTKGKYLDEIDIPKSDVEKENDESYI